jgi:hypothetical protein
MAPSAAVGMVPNPLTFREKTALREEARCLRERGPKGKGASVAERL